MSSFLYVKLEPNQAVRPGWAIGLVVSRGICTAVKLYAC